MAKRIMDNIKLGTVVLAGLVFLVVLLYMIGKNRSMFGATYVLKVRFENVQGLVAGNNVRFAGIEAGTVKKIDILNDTAIEVTMVINKKMLTVIRKNAIVSIGTEGFVGNKVVNIVPDRKPAPLAAEGDLLVAKNAMDTDRMLQTLGKTNDDISVIAQDLKLTVQRINNSSGLWGLLDDQSIPQDIKTSLTNIRLATRKAGVMADNLQAIVADVKNGKGSAGAILKDSSFAKKLNQAISKINYVGDEADSLTHELSKMIAGVQKDVNSGSGVVNSLLKDSMMVIKLNNSLDNIREGTDRFNENMEALKHNFLFRGYFKKQEKKRQKEQERNEAQAN